jgi:uncharacterized protein (TIGR03086 family)
MLPNEAFIVADRGFNAVVQHIRDDQWDLQLPEGFVRRDPEKPVTLREVINYHAYDEAWIPDMFAGRTMAEVGPTTFDGDLLGDDPRASYAALAEKATAAAQALTDLTRPIHWSYGSFPAEEGIWHVTSFRTFRTVDVARVIGVDDRLDPTLVEFMWDRLVAQAERLRAAGILPPKIEVPEDAPLQERFLGLAGRPPKRPSDKPS